eukprot:Hpha_TRINITY_DN28553_c0_g1::TRINITY_DN28553_c0_g1_i1::g.18631::m.18631
MGMVLVVLCDAVAFQYTTRKGQRMCDMSDDDMMRPELCLSRFGVALGMRDEELEAIARGDEDTPVTPARAPTSLSESSSHFCTSPSPSRHRTRRRSVEPPVPPGPPPSGGGTPSRRACVAVRLVNAEAMESQTPTLEYNP